MYLAVLVALDGSQPAAAAIPPALEMAKAFMARLILLRVVPLAVGSDGATQRDYDAQRFQAEEYLESLRRSLRTRGVRIESLVRSGDPASEILETIRSLNHPLVVITAFGRTPPQNGGELGTVAQELLRSAEGPVVLVRPQVLKDSTVEMSA
jgi:nucleotide-binding universal stress UspA family protein